MRRWSDLNRVERVGLYTRQSLYLMLWSFNGFVLLSGVNQVSDGAAVLLAGGIVVTALTHRVLGPLLHRHPLGWRPVAPLLVCCGAYVVVAEATLSGAARGAAVMTVITSLAMLFGLLRDFRVVLALIAACGLLGGIIGGTWLSVVAGSAAASLFVFTVRASMWLFGIVADLDEASVAKAQLAVVEERLRFSRDVHDVLGRRLSTIAVQAELAATLSARGDERAAEQMLEVRGVAHEALREARELARGYRGTDFVNELDGASSLLRSAGIEVKLSVDDMPRAWHEAAAWVVRESVTNVLRHSSATVVEITYADGRLRVDNDGARANGAGNGSGLRGLRERLAPLGASLITQAQDGGHWSLVAELPGSGPLSATKAPS